MVTKPIPSLYMCVHMCHLLLVHRHLCHTFQRPEPRRKRGLGRAEMGKVPLLGLGKAQQGCPAIQGGLTQPTPAGFCLENWLKARGICFPSAGSLRAGFSGFSPRFSQVAPVPRGSPQLSFTLPVKVSQ